MTFFFLSFLINLMSPLGKTFQDPMKSIIIIMTVTDLKFSEELDSIVMWKFDLTKILLYGSEAKVQKELRSKQHSLIVNWKT